MKRRYKPRRCPIFKTEAERMAARRETRLAWKKRHKEKVKAIEQKLYLQTKEQKRQKAREYYQKHKEELIQRAKERAKLMPIWSDAERQELLKTMENMLKSRRQKC